MEASRRDPAIFARLYRHYATPIYRFLYKWTGSVDEAEEDSRAVDHLSGLCQVELDGATFGRWDPGC